jgi:hypothetical protein
MFRCRHRRRCRQLPVLSKPRPFGTSLDLAAALHDQFETWTRQEGRR